MLRPSGKPAADLQTVRLEPISYSDGRHRVATMAESHHPEGWQHAPGSQMGLRSFFRGEKSSTGPTQGSTSIAQVVSPSLPSGDEPTHAPMHIIGVSSPHLRGTAASQWPGTVRKAFTAQMTSVLPVGRNCCPIIKKTLKPPRQSVR